MTADIRKAVAILQSGGLVAFPTETVYGLGADASNEAAVRKIFAAKERPYNHPLIVHIANVEMMSEWAMDISDDAMRVAGTFWPGPLTLILKKQPQVLDVITGGQGTVGLRLPRHAIARSLLEAFGKGIAAPSANKFTHVSPTTSGAVYEELGANVDLILDGGACEVGLESTILDMSGEYPVVLRPGMISLQMLSEVLGKEVVSHQKSTVQTRAPGMHHLHYAPQTETILLTAQEINAWLEAHADKSVAIILREADKSFITEKSNTQMIMMPNDAAAYAHDLYHQLRTTDHEKLTYIIIAQVPSDPKWDAIRDRIFKATAAR